MVQEKYADDAAYREWKNQHFVEKTDGTWKTYWGFDVEERTMREAYEKEQSKQGHEGRR